ncbi:MAG: hypothetical protein V4722_28140 [Bacteroidota bacterium]
MQFQKSFFHKYCSIFFIPFGIIFGFTCSLKAQKASKKLELYHCTGDFPTNTLAYLKKAGMPKVPIFDNRYIDPEGDMRINADLLKKTVLEEIPNARDTGLAILDWESDAFTTLYTAKASSDSFKLVFKEYLKALTLCQKLRPKMKWGFYHIPITDYWLNDTLAWQQANKNLLPLLRQSDVLYPSMYNHYPDTTTHTHNSYYIDYNIRQSLKLGAALKKKVVVFVWHRYHEGNTRDGLRLIPEAEFYASLKRMIDFKIDNKRIDGLMWFAGDAFYLNIKPSLLPIENPLKKSIAVHYDDIVKKYFLLFQRLKKYYSNL